MVTLGQNEVFSLAEFERLVIQHEEVELDEQVVVRVQKNFNFLKTYASSKVIYGINTGLGPMAQYRINEGDQLQLQYNLIRSHATGAGKPFSEVMSRATLTARLISLCQGRSGIHPDTLRILCTLLNKHVSPLIFEHGGVGASGDLIQLAHLALVMIGEGEVFLNGTLLPTKQAYSDLGIDPLSIYLREGLAVMNGTSAMTGIGLLNLINARKCLNLAISLSAVTNELMKSFDDHFSSELNSAKRHVGQQQVAAAMQDILADSKLIRKRPEHLYHRKIEEAVFSDKVQEYYSLRCVPQILGPILDTLTEVEEVLINELNSVNDNPVIDDEKEMVYHGGNFHGDYVSLAMDKLKTSITKLSMLSERQLNYLLNDRLNQKLPPFINLGQLGLNFGLQGLQFTATSTVAQNQTLSFPMYVHSIPNNNDNQDLVSMGCNAALLTGKVIDGTLDVLTIQTIAVMQSIDYLKNHSRLSTFAKAWYESIRMVLPPVVDDAPLYKYIQSVRASNLNAPASKLKLQPRYR